mmetsp:Transcript_91171/g.288877  ORF Transcript_91171/g.288877 Transcript_91171/m.288877 type:complete len:131 (-) Transcript_91171:146-538(-)
MAIVAHSRSCLRTAMFAVVGIVACWCVLPSPATFVAGTRAAPARLSSPLVPRRVASAQVSERVADIVADLLNVDKEMLSDDMPLRELGDSLDIAESIFYLEEAFDVELALDEMADFKSLGEVASLIEAKM